MIDYIKSITHRLLTFLGFIKDENIIRKVIKGKTYYFRVPNLLVCLKLWTEVQKKETPADETSNDFLRVLTGEVLEYADILMTYCQNPEAPKEDPQVFFDWLDSRGIAHQEFVELAGFFLAAVLRKANAAGRIVERQQSFLDKGVAKT